MDRIERFESTIKQEIESVKRSILYDLHKNINDIKNTLALNVCVDRPLGTLLTECKNNLAVSLPFDTVEQFVEFNEQLSSNIEKEKSYVRILIILIRIIH